MIEGEWLVCNDPFAMFDQVEDRFSDRKVRLYACARARQQWHLLDDPSRRALEVAERFADGQANTTDLLVAFRWADEAWAAIPEYSGSRRAMRRETRGRASAKAAAWDVRVAANPDLQIRHVRYAAWGLAKKLVSLADVLRELFGPLAIRPFEANLEWLAWNGGAVAALARSIFEEQAFEDMPILGDALEDAGCERVELIEHCRSVGRHVRGCWVIDLLTGHS